MRDRKRMSGGTGSGAGVFTPQRHPQSEGPHIRREEHPRQAEEECGCAAGLHHVLVSHALRLIAEQRPVLRSEAV